jgi:ornithine carbamoyltransferase
MSKRDFLSVDDVDPDELVALLDGADRHKADRRPRDTLGGRSVALVFEKPSTRTRVSFEVAVHELGGYPLPLSGAELQLGRGETLEDTAAVLSRYIHAIVLRTFAQESLERLARGGTIPVVNALSDYSHPCQALADLQTIRERRGRLQGIRLAYLGDGNNVAHSLLFAGSKMGMHVAVATPLGYEPIPQLSTDTVMAAAPDVMVLHCLPAHRGEEIAAEVMDGPNSAVFDQAENRLHTQKALLSWLLTGSADPS